jgi:hypothetical protein
MSNTAQVDSFQEQLAVTEEGEFILPDINVSDPLIEKRGYQCASMAYSYYCPRCKEKMQKARLCGNRWECPICARTYAKVKGRALYARLKNFKASHYREFVFTFSPEVVGQLFSGLTYDEISKATIRGVGCFLKSWFGEGIGFVCYSHGWASSDPLGKAHWHVHVLMPCLRFNSERQSWVKLPYWIHDFMLMELRKAWGRFNGVSELVVYHEYWRADQVGKFRHKCNYVCRRPVLDVNDYLLKHDIKAWEPGQYHRFLELSLHGRNFRNSGYFGFMSYGVIGKYLKKRGTSLEAVKIEVERLASIEGRYFCPFCHFDVTEVVKAGSFVYEETEISRLMHRKLVWKKFEDVAT